MLNLLEKNFHLSELFKDSRSTIVFDHPSETRALHVVLGFWILYFLTLLHTFHVVTCSSKIHNN